MECLHSAGTWW